MATKPTKKKTQTPGTADPFAPKPDQPLVPKSDDKAPASPSTPDFRKSSRADTLRKTSQITPSDEMRDMLSRMQDIEGVDDEPEYAVAEPVTPETVPKVINRELVADGVSIPDWHIVANLPGNMSRAIRTVGRQLFGAMTRTPTDSIVMIANVLGQGPNTSREINAVANWLRNTGQEVSSGDIDFENFIPGYSADVKMYRAANCRFLLVRDQFGQYIYTWPESDSKY